MDELLAALRDDFYGQERIRQMLLNCTPRYGNDDAADDLMCAAFEAFFQVVDGRPKYQGGCYHVN